MIVRNEMCKYCNRSENYPSIIALSEHSVFTNAAEDHFIFI